VADTDQRGRDLAFAVAHLGRAVACQRWARLPSLGAARRAHVLGVAAGERMSARRYASRLGALPGVPTLALRRRMRGLFCHEIAGRLWCPDRLDAMLPEPPAHRAIVELWVRHGMTFRAIAALTGYSARWVGQVVRSWAGRLRVGPRADGDLLGAIVRDVKPVTPALAEKAASVRRTPRRRSP
jgi:hypothetical protein